MVDQSNFREVGEKFLEHFGAKGMKWGVRKNDKGSGGTLSVKFKPTYTTEERRAAAKNVKLSKTSGKPAKDSSGASQERIAQLRTPSRRVVNAILGTKVSTSVSAVSGLAAVGIFMLTPAGAPLTTAAVIGIGTANAAAQIGGLHANYKAYFNNMVKNPKVKLTTKLSANDMANYAVGKTITKSILSDRGSAKISINKNSVSVIPKDQEGRNLGKQTITRVSNA